MNTLSPPDLLIAKSPVSALELIERHVRDEVNRYLERRIQKSESVWLIENDELERALLDGSLKFGEADFPMPEVQLAEAVRAAREAFQDGVVLLWFDGRVVTDPAAKISLRKTSRVAFFRLAAIRGY